MKVKKQKTKLTTGILITTVLILTSCAGTPRPEPGASAELNAFMNAYNENCSYKYNGAILVAKGDEVLLSRAWGTADYKNNTDNSLTTVFPIGSVTKSITAAAIMQLEERGLLKTNDPISKYLDGHPRADEITIHQLLNHTAGIEREVNFLHSRHVSMEDNLNYINSRPLLFNPGEDHTYSNAGYVLLAAIIEKVTGETYNNYIAKNIFAPLKMNSSRGGTDASYAEDQAIGYEITTSRPRPLSIFNFSCITGCGNIYSTIEDVYKYSRGLAGGKIITPESFGKITSPQWGNSDYGYGYGWQINRRYGREKISHGGCIGGGGYNSLVIKYPDDDYLLIFLTNNADRTALDTVSQTLEAIIFGEDYVMPGAAETVEVAPETLKKWAGDYDLGGMIVTVSYKNGNLYSTADDNKLYRLYPTSGNSFYYEDHQCTTADFEVNEDDKTVSLTIRSRTHSIRGSRIN